MMHRRRCWISNIEYVDSSSTLFQWNISTDFGEDPYQVHQHKTKSRIRPTNPTVTVHPAGKSSDLSQVQLRQLLQTSVSACELFDGVSLLLNSRQSLVSSYCCSEFLENCELAFISLSCSLSVIPGLKTSFSNI